MPDVREIIDKMKGSKYFSKLDMASAYWAVPIREEDRRKIAFMTPRKLIEMCVTAYGLCNSQATYQRIMDKTLDGIEGAEGFVDNVCKFLPTFKGMLEVTRAVLQRLREVQLQMRTDKCKFSYQDVEFVGHHISGDGVASTADNVKAILDFPEPSILSELEQFIGMANYYREFIQHFARIAELLNRLRRAGQLFEWSDECSKAFKDLCSNLSSPTILAYPDWENALYIEANMRDASVGGTLSQLNKDRKILQLVGYFSSFYDWHQQNYSPGERECWALIACTRKWHTYCWAALKLYLITDHNPLKCLREQKGLCGSTLDGLLSWKPCHMRLLAEKIWII